MSDQIKKYFLYARKSTDEPERQILSIEAQLFELKEYAKKENLCVVKEFIESKTAKQPGREIFNTMIAGIEQGEAKGILAWHPDRLARNSIDGGRIIYLVDIGKIIDLKFPTFWFDSTPQGKFMLSIAFGQSKYYVDNLSENIKRGIRQKLRNGIWPQWAPLGYLNDRINRCIVIDKDKAPLIRKAFELYASGRYPLVEVQKTINDSGLIGKKDKMLGVSNYQYMFKNPVYYGVIRFQDQIYEGKHEPIITKKLFDRVQEVMKQKSKSHTRQLKPYIYRGMFRCGECGCFITSETQKGYNYLHCTKRKVDCSQRYIREEVINDHLRQSLKKVSLCSPWANSMIAELEKETLERRQTDCSFADVLRNQIKELESKLDILLDMSLNKTISQEEYAIKRNKLIPQKVELKEKLKEFEQKSGNRFELMIEFIKEASTVEVISLRENHEEIRDFIKKIGSNFKIFERELSFDFKMPWKILSNFKSEARAGKSFGSKNSKSEVWRRGRDSNPRYGFSSVYRFSKPAH